MLSIGIGENESTIFIIHMLSTRKRNLCELWWTSDVVRMSDASIHEKDVSCFTCSTSLYDSWLCFDRRPNILSIRDGNSKTVQAALSSIGRGTYRNDEHHQHIHASPRTANVLGGRNKYTQTFFVRFVVFVCGRSETLRESSWAIPIQMAHTSERMHTSKRVHSTTEQTPAQLSQCQRQALNAMTMTTVFVAMKQLNEEKKSIEFKLFGSRSARTTKFHFFIHRRYSIFRLASSVNAERTHTHAANERNKKTVIIMLLHKIAANRYARVSMLLAGLGLFRWMTAAINAKKERLREQRWRRPPETNNWKFATPESWNSTGKLCKRLRECRRQRSGNAIRRFMGQNVYSAFNDYKCLMDVQLARQFQMRRCHSLPIHSLRHRHKPGNVRNVYAPSISVRQVPFAWCMRRNATPSISSHFSCQSVSKL